MIGVRTRIAIVPKAVNRLAARPSVGTAIFCSFLVHAATFSVTYLCSNQTKQSSVAGRRNAIHLQAVFAKERRPQPLEAVLDARPEPNATSDARRPRPAPVAAANVSLRQRQDSRHETSLDMAHVAKRGVSGVMEDVRERLADAAPPARRAHELSDSRIEPPEVPLRRSRRVDARPSAVPRVAMEQVAGVDEKTLPDLAGNRPPPTLPRQFETAWKARSS